jgi:hypothetical protein
MKKLTKEEFIIRAKCLLGDNYDFTKTTYINSHIKTIITCKTHGDFLILPCNVLQHNCGCPLCAGDKISKSFSLTREEFEKKAKKVHNNKYCYALSNYINNKSKIKIICPIHGIFEQLPNNHLSGSGCPECAKIRHEQDQA